MQQTPLLTQLYNNDTSKDFDYFMKQRIHAETELNLLCVLSKQRIEIPVRHNKVNNINCLFELKNYLDFIKDKDNFSCVACKAYVSPKDFGIDYNILNVLTIIKRFVKDQGNYNVKKLIYDPSQKKFYILNKQKQKILLPGCTPIYGIQKQQATDTNLLAVTSGLGETLMKMQQYLLRAKLNGIKKGTSERIINNAFQAQNKLINQVLKANCKLIEIGQKSQKNDIVFTFQKIDISQEGEGAALLIVYYVYYGIWLNFEIQRDGKPFQQLEQVLYIKDYNQQLGQHQIYVIGGKLPKYKQSKAFTRITIPKDPFEKNLPKVIQAEKLPDLLKEGYNYMGTIDKGSIYIFYGQQRFVNDKQCIDDVLLNVAQVYENNKWTDMNCKPIDRFEGSYFTFSTPGTGKCLFFFGGITHKPEGLGLAACTQQKGCQIFQLSTRTFLGQLNPYPGFEMTYPPVLNLQRSLAAPVFSIPQYGDKRLIMSGEYVKQNLSGKRQIFTLDWTNATIEVNEVLSLEPPEILMTAYSPTGNRSTLFIPIQDFEGCIAYNEYFTLHLKLTEAQNVNGPSEVSLLKFNLTSGKFTQIPYQSTQESIKMAIEQRNSLPERPDREV